MHEPENSETEFLPEEHSQNDDSQVGDFSEVSEDSSVSEVSDIADQQLQIDLLKQQLAEAQKLTALGELVGTTTHEFNNILMTVLNYAKMGMRHRDDQTRDKAFDKILAASQRAAKITN